MLLKILIILMVLIILILYWANFLYKRTNHNKNFFENANKFIDGVPDKLELVCTGSSYAKYDIDFSHTELRTFNFGVFPQSLNYDYKILQQYKKNMQENCLILITLAPLVFGFADYENDSSNYKYYKFLKKKYINKYSFKTHITHVKFPLMATPRLSKYIIQDVPYINLFDCNYISEEYTKSEAELRARGWCNQFNLKNLKDNFVSEEINSNFIKTTHILKSIIKLCKENHFIPIILIPPVSEELASKFSKNFLDAYLYDNILKLECNDVQVFDFFNDRELKNNKYYFNADFMNADGRKLFTDKILSKIIEQQL